LNELVIGTLIQKYHEPTIDQTIQLMKRRDNSSKEKDQPTASSILIDQEIPTSPTPIESLTTVKARKRGRRAVRRDLHKQAVRNVLDELKPPTDYPAWYLIGAIIFLCNHFFNSEKMKILTSNVLDKLRWCTIVRKFTHSCLLWAQEPGYGPSLDDLNNAFNRLAKSSLRNLENAFSNVNEWSGDFLIKKIFQFKTPEGSQCTGDLFKLVMLNKMKEKPLWIQNEECSTLQIGLRVCWSEKHDFDNILAPFLNFRPSVQTFKTVSQFWTWLHQSPQATLFSDLKWNGPVHNSLIGLGKKNMEEKIPVVSLVDVTAPTEVMMNTDKAHKNPLAFTGRNQIDLTSILTQEDHQETVLTELIPRINKKNQNEQKKSMNTQKKPVQSKTKENESSKKTKTITERKRRASSTRNETTVSSKTKKNDSSKKNRDHH